MRTATAWIDSWQRRWEQAQVAKPQLEDAKRMASEILQSLPTVMAVLPAMEVEAVLSDLPRMT